jgi:2-furoate---CoA ligase
MNVATMLRWSAERWPQCRAVGGPQPLTYAQWDDRTDRLARALAGLGVGGGDRVALSVAGGEPLASAHLALQKLGAISVPLSTRFDAGELGTCLADAEVGLIISDARHTEVAHRAVDDLDLPVRHAHTGEGDAPPGSADLARLGDRGAGGAPFPNPSPDAVSVMLYTAGTTGRAKGVPRTHRAEHAAALAHVVQAQYRLGERTLGVMPMFHTMGLRTLLATIAVGGTWVPQAVFEPDAAIELIAAERVSALYLVPTLYWSLVNRPDRSWTEPVTRLAYAGAPMTVPLTETLAELCRPDVFVNHVGSTEIYTFTVCTDVVAKPGCAGRAGVFARVRIVDPDPDAPPDATVGPGREGQLIVSMESPEAFTGYWHRPDATAAAVRHGWYFTRDLARTDDDGDLWVEGRVDDMINSGGENIFPGDIESALERCPAVSEVVVAGTPDDRWGQAVTAFVVAGADLAADDAAATVARYALTESRLPGLKRPKRVVVVDRIPKSAVGKILRRSLLEGSFTALAEAPVAGGAADEGGSPVAGGSPGEGR